MLKFSLVHPQILETLGRAGHTSKVLIADSNYPAATRVGPHARLVHLNLSPGIVTATEVLHALAGAIPLEAAHVMQPAGLLSEQAEHEPPIWAEYRAVFRSHGLCVEFEAMNPDAFYEQSAGRDVALVVVTADQRTAANLLLTVGVSL